MKKKLLLIIVVCFLFSSISTGNTAEPLYFNGYDWQNLSSTSKTYFVLGWAKGGQAAYNCLPFNVNKWNESIEFLKLADENFRDRGVLFSGVAIGPIVDTIDRLYYDPRLKTMDITEVMPLVCSRLIQGWTEKDLDEIIAINIILKRCEEREGKVGVLEECSSARKAKRSYLQKLKKK